MAYPTTTLETLRPDLGGSMLEYPLDAMNNGFIGLEVLPVLEADKQSGSFGIIPVEQLLKVPEVSRTSNSGYSRGGFTFQDDSYSTKEYGYEEPVDERNKAIYSSYFDMELISALRARSIILRRAEIRYAAAIFNTSTWTGASLTTAVTNEWDDYTNAVPINDVEGAVRKVYDGTGLWPNALIMNRKVFRNLRLCDQIIDAIRSAGAGNPTKASDITTNMLSAVFDLPKIIVAGGAYDSATEGQSATISDIWSSEYAMVARVATTNDIAEPCIGRTIHWAADGSSIGGVVESYYSPEVRANIIRVRHEVTEKILYAQCGHLLSNVTTI